MPEVSVSARYPGFRENRNGPLVTRAVAGLRTSKLVRVLRNSRRAESTMIPLARINAIPTGYWVSAGWSRTGKNSRA